MEKGKEKGIKENAPEVGKNCTVLKKCKANLTIFTNDKMYLKCFKFSQWPLPLKTTRKPNPK